MFDTEAQENNDNRDTIEQKGEQNIFSYDVLDTTDPRQRGIWHMLKSTICPNLTLKSFTTIVTIINITVFCIQLGVDGIKIPGKFLEPKIGKVILNFGRLYGGMREKYQFWRTITCLFLHGSFSHIFYNTLSMLIWGSLLERLMGESFLRMVGFWILTGISGDFFSSWFQKGNQVAVGASTAIYGVFGVFIGFLILNWHRLERSKYSRMSAIMGISFIILFNIGLSGSSKDASIDNLAHVGGFISGIFVGLFMADLPKSTTENYEKRIKFLGVLLYLGFTSLSLLMTVLFTGGDK